jgi:hypothetical protein
MARGGGFMARGGGIRATGGGFRARVGGFKAKRMDSGPEVYIRPEPYTVTVDVELQCGAEHRVVSSFNAHRASGTLGVDSGTVGVELFTTGMDSGTL